MAQVNTIRESVEDNRRNNSLYTGEIGNGTRVRYAMAMDQRRPKVGVGVIVRKGENVLLGKRIGAHGSGTWSFPGGHLEFGEDVFGCAVREVYEETGLAIKNLIRGPYTNDVLEVEQKHYITLFVVGDYGSGMVKVCEPDKCEEWKWYTWDNLPQPLFLPIVHLVQTGYSPFLQ